MKIDKAIEILDYYRTSDCVHLTPDARDALKLGIEALKRVKGLRRFWGKDINLKLPGETED